MLGEMGSRLRLFFSAVLFRMPFTTILVAASPPLLGPPDPTLSVYGVLLPDNSSLCLPEGPPVRQIGSGSFP